MQCGIASLAMICQYFGKRYSIDELQDICFATTEGVSMLGICQAARTLGLDCMAGRVSVEQLIENGMPCILHWNQNHFVVLYKVSKGRKFYIADPGKGKITYTREEFERHWLSTHSDNESKGIAMFFEPTEKFGSYHAESEEKRRSFRFLFGYLKGYRKHFVQIIIGLAVGCLIQLVMPFLTQAIVDVGIKNHDIGFIWLVHTLV